MGLVVFSLYVSLVGISLPGGTISTPDGYGNEVYADCATVYLCLLDDGKGGDKYYKASVPHLKSSAEVTYKNCITEEWETIVVQGYNEDTDDGKHARPPILAVPGTWVKVKTRIADFGQISGEHEEYNCAYGLRAARLTIHHYDIECGQPGWKEMYGIPCQVRNGTMPEPRWFYADECNVDPPQPPPRPPPPPPPTTTAPTTTPEPTTASTPTTTPEPTTAAIQKSILQPFGPADSRSMIMETIVAIEGLSDAAAADVIAEKEAEYAARFAEKQAAAAQAAAAEAGAKDAATKEQADKDAAAAELVAKREEEKDAVGRKIIQDEYADKDAAEAEHSLGNQ